jgi:hypothetical protein
MRRSKQHLMNWLERPRRYGMPYLIAVIGVLNMPARVTTRLAADPLF